MAVFRLTKAAIPCIALGALFFSSPSIGSMDRLSVGSFDPHLEQSWHHQAFGNKTSYDYITLEDRDTIKAEGNVSASGLFTELSSGTQDKQNIEWAWRVDQIHQSADLRLEDKEDFAASLFLVFTDSKKLFPSYQILIYAWSSTDLPVGTVIESPRDPDRIRTMILGNNETPLEKWMSEERNFLEDYQKAFGKRPEKPLKTVGIFTDNDNTQEPVTSYYAPIAVW